MPFKIPDLQYVFLINNKVVTVDTVTNSRKVVSTREHFDMAWQLNIDLIQSII